MREGTGARGAGSPGQGSRGPVPPECRSAPSFPRKRPRFQEGKGVAVPSSRWGNLWPGMEAKEISQEMEGHRGSASAGKGEKLPSLSSARGQPANPRVSSLAASRPLERGFTPLPSESEEGKAGARRWADFEEWWRRISASTLPCSPRQQTQTALSPHTPGARFPFPAWPPPAPASALNEILWNPKKRDLMLHPYLWRSEVFLPRRRHLLNNPRLSPWKERHCTLRAEYASQCA